MDTSDPQIRFDGSGFCNNCSDYLENLPTVSTNESLDQLFERVRLAGKSSDYDCVLGVSGGVDSSYAAVLCHEHGIRPLAVHMDNGWDSEESVANVRTMLSTLEIDYESYVLDWEEFRAIQLAFLRASVPEAETPTDVAIPAALHHFAAKHNVKYIVSAGNYATEGLLPKSWHYNARDLTYFSHIVNEFGPGELRTFPTFDFKKEAYFKILKGIRFVYPLNQAGSTQGEMEKLLVDKFGYRVVGGKHHESRYTRFIQSYYLFVKFGIDYRRATFSSQILSGEMDRDVALKNLETLPYDAVQIEQDKHYVAKKLEISLDELESIVALPPKWYWDYPNSDRKLSRIYSIYRKFFSK